ncbi:MAG TPA: nitrilase-related carbon-nitrogen hydrolase [Abditibacteriaceae bacterium]|jgi:predicted amidohydrolase
MTLHGIQFDIAWEQPTKNYARVLELLEANPPAPGSLVVLPELFATGFSMNIELVAGASRDTEMFCAAVASKFDLWIVGGVGVGVPNNRARNEAVAWNPDGKVVARYAKLHPFSYGKETQHYDAGEKIVTFDWNGLRVAPFVCYDLRFPEIFRAAQADIYCIGANWPASRAEHWNVLLRARAIENQAYVVGVNRCGNDPQLEYSGESLVVGPRGEILAESGSVETVFGGAVDMAGLQKYRDEFSALKDRRAGL